MKIKSIYLFILIFSILTFSCKEDEIPTGPQFNSLEEELDDIANQYVEVGAIFGIINKQQERIIRSYGGKSIYDSSRPDTNTVFEIGSITKTFTCILLADIYFSGGFTDDTVSHYLPADEVTIPSGDGVEIRFIHLATHSSGIPRNPHIDGYILPEEYDETKSI